MQQVFRLIFPFIWISALVFAAAVVYLSLQGETYIQDMFPSLIWVTKWGYVAIIFSIVLAFLITLTYLLFVLPIRHIRMEVARFLTGVWSDPGVFKLFHPDMIFVSNFFHKSLEILKTFKAELQSGRVLRSEVELAAEIQKATLTKELPIIPSMSIVANSKSATEVGGDSYDVLKKWDNYYIYLGDVTGHGVASGFVMMVVNALISGFANLMESGAEILAQTNVVMKPRVKKNMLMTLLLLRWNEATKQLFMTGAGHEHLIVYKASVGQAVKIRSGGVALGMASDIRRALKDVQVKIDPGDIIVLYTDGITEARNGRDPATTTLFGVERLVQTVQDAPIKTAQGVYNHITITLSKFMGYQHKQFDDITLITAHYHAGKGVNVADVAAQISPHQITEWTW